MKYKNSKRLILKNNNNNNDFYKLLEIFEVLKF